MSKCLCQVYRHPRKEGVYLYVKRDDQLSRVPDALLQQFGEPQLVMTMVLSADKKLAQLSVEKLLQELEDKGYYLQMPVSTDDYMREIHRKNNKMGQ